MRRLPALASSAAAARDLLHAERSPILELASARREAHSGVLICPIGSRIAGGVKEVEKEKVHARMQVRGFALKRGTLVYYST